MNECDLGLSAESDLVRDLAYVNYACNYWKKTVKPGTKYPINP